MKNKILKLCKRLGKATVDEISPILCLTNSEIYLMLEGLVSEGCLNKRSDGVYFYIEPKPKQQKPLFLKFRTKQELELLIKCFCAGLPAIKTSVITELARTPITDFNAYIRRRFYEIQFEELKKLYEDKPYTPRIRNILDETVYFYYYDKTYISEIKLKSDKKEEFLPKIQDLEFRKDYLKHIRRVTHNMMKNHLTHHIAENLLRIKNKNEFIAPELINKIVLQ